MKKEKPKKEVVSKELAIRNIVSWLYVNDGSFPNKLKWREGLLEVIAWNIKRIK